MQYRKLIPTIIKYLLNVVFMFIVYSFVPSRRHLLTWLIELTLIIVITNLIMCPKGEKVKLRRIAGRVVNSVLLLFFNAQILIFYFARSYIVMVMLTNVDNIYDLEGGVFKYAVGIGVVLLLSIWPVQYIMLKDKGDVSGESRTRLLNYRMLIVAFAAELFVISYFDVSISPAYGYMHLVKQQMERNRLAKTYMTDSNAKAEFYREAIDDNIAKPDSLSDNPNIVIIMAEGVSRNVILDERGIMPNVKKLEENSICFTGYYDHTFATYRGIIGQLYSGYQNYNYDSNSMISIMDILRDRGYDTVMINSEPTNQEFCDYAANLGFDEVVTEEPKDGGYGGSLSDKNCYDLLYRTIEAENSKDVPYLIVIYTFGTHTSFNSVNEVYGDGSSPLLNKFYDMDYQFGDFFDKWSESELSDDTLLVFTTDHATYTDESYAAAFPDYYEERPNSILDEIPLVMWHKGVDPVVIDAFGRNSLDMAPTVLDYIDVTAENYFLGETLFNPYGTWYDTTFQSEMGVYSSDRRRIRSLYSEEAEEKWEYIYKYFGAAGD